MLPTPLISPPPPARSSAHGRKAAHLLPINVPKACSEDNTPHIVLTPSGGSLGGPRPFKYSMSILFDLPHRLAYPPNARKSDGSRWKVAPEMDVSLEDILSMRHLSPLGLKDFEQYLLFEEYGAENLYFVLWMKDYTSRFNAGATPVQLSLSVARAKATFFSSDSKYELNLASSRSAEFLAFFESTDADTTSGSAPSPVYPHPSGLAAIFSDVEDMLRISARRFVRARSRNASSQRAFCVMFGVFATFAISLVPLLLSFVGHKGRWIRFGVFPPLWIGLTMVVCATNGLCFLLYFLGGSRQLHPFELHRPPISAPIPRTPNSLYEPSMMTTDTLPDVKLPTACIYPSSPSTTSFGSSGFIGSVPPDHGKTPVDMFNPYSLPEIKATSSITDEFEFETAGFIPTQHVGGIDVCVGLDAELGMAPSTISLDDVSSGTGSKGRTPKLVFDFDSLPVNLLDSTTGPRALQAARGRGVQGFLGSVFAPLACIESPVVSRAQWEVAMRSGAVAVLLALAITGILVGVPFEDF